MALLYFNGFDFMANGTADLPDRGIINVGPGVNGVATGGRGDGKLLGLTVADAYLNVQGWGSVSTIIAGFAWKWHAAPAISGSVILRDAANADLVRINRNTSGYVEATNGSGTLLGTGTTFIVPDNWYYIEVKAYIHASTGTLDVRINSVAETGLDGLTGLNTRGPGGTATDRVLVVGYGYFDDLYICDTTGGVNDDFLGDVSCQAIFPTGNGASSDFTGSDGNSVDNYLLVDDVGPDDDTTYVASGTPTDKDLYEYGSISATSGTIIAVQPLLYARKDDAGARSIASVARLSGGTEADGPDISIGETYSYYADIRTTKPGGGAWSVADVNGAQFGVKVTA